MWFALVEKVTSFLESYFSTIPTAAIMQRFSANQRIELKTNNSQIDQSEIEEIRLESGHGIGPYPFL